MHDIKMGFIDTVNDNIIDSAIKKPYKGGNLEESVQNSVQVDTIHKYMFNKNRHITDTSQSVSHG